MYVLELLLPWLNMNVHEYTNWRWFEVSIVSLLFISQDPPPHHPLCFTIIHHHITKQILISVCSIILTQFASLIHQKKLITTLPPYRRTQREHQTNNPSPSSSSTCIKTKIQKKITENLHSHQTRTPFQHQIFMSHLPQSFTPNNR